MNLSALVALSEDSITLERNEYLKVAGSIDLNVYYIESGSLKVYVLDEYEEQIIRFGYEGNLIVALDSYLTGEPSPFYMQVIKKSVLKVITKKQINKWLNEDEEHRIFWTKILETLVVQQIEREIDILTTSPKERYLRVLKRSPQLFQHIPGRYIANYLRMTPETLSRLKKF